mmetsp:Transcript_14657/g.35704  ORF Transcript_14657/g.35704 Transcript_14657/m.35704 type:complete len:356 (+) Transcript_14657:1433-2500(+)
MTNKVVTTTIPTIDSIDPPEPTDVEGHPEYNVAVAGAEPVNSTATDGQGVPPSGGTGCVTISESARAIANPSNQHNKCCGCWRGCCSFPQLENEKHGRRIWIIVFVASIIGLALCDAGTDVCGFIQATVKIIDTNTTIVEETRDVGINVYEDTNGECIPWRKGDEKDWIYGDGDGDVNANDDTLWVAVRYLVGIAAVVSVIGVIAFAFAPCVVFPRFVWNTFTFIWMLSWFMYSLSFVIFGSDLCMNDECTFDKGAALILVGVVVWIPSSLGVWYLSRIARSAAKKVTDNEDVDQHQVSTEGKQEGPPHASDFNEISREEAENDKKRRWWVGWIVVTSILLAASIVTNAVVITSK